MKFIKTLGIFMVLWAPQSPEEFPTGPTPMDLDSHTLQTHNNNDVALSLSHTYREIFFGVLHYGRGKTRFWISQLKSRSVG